MPLLQQGEDKAVKFLVRGSINIAFWDFKKNKGDSSEGEENEPAVTVQRQTRNTETGEEHWIPVDGGTYKEEKTDILYSGDFGSIFRIILNKGTVQYDLNETEIK